MSNRFAIVTGAGSGIGKATGQVLAERGYDVGLTYGKNVDGVERTAEAVRAQGQRAFVAQMQLEAPDSIGRAIDQLSTATAMRGAPEGSVADRKRSEIPAGRPGKSREMAVTVAYLLDPEASYTTGTTLVVDGGLLLMAAIPNQRTRMASSH
jgi:NAD(P)-dependent dehydrogenase (short-subunit alcohol dehydrogenase family)